MRNSLTLGTRGKLSKNVKKSLIIASFGLIAIASATQGGGFENASYEVYENIREQQKEKKIALRIQDEDEILLIIKIFTQCL